MAKQVRTLKGQVVAITGGARGIGKATAAALLREGARVGIGDIDAGMARETADALASEAGASGGEVRAYEVDVTSRPSIAAFLDAVEADLGPLDVLVNNAGIMPVGSFLDESDSAAVRQVDINLHGVSFGMKEALPRMLARRRGHIVNLASIAGRTGVPYLASYCATKHAVVGLTEAVDAELRGSGIDFTCVMPAMVNTELTAGLQAGRGVKKAEPEDVAGAIVAALREPRFDVFVPRSLAVISKITDLLPRSLSNAISRLLEADKVMARADMEGRAAYEQRIARSEPTPLEPAEPAENVPEQPAA